MQYYRIDPDMFSKKWAYALPYSDCLNYDHNKKEIYCPLCKRGVGGSAWLGPYKVYLSSSKIPDIIYGTNFDALWNESIVEKFQKAELKGINFFQKFEVFYRGKMITQSFFAPIYAYSNKKVQYAEELNKQRKINKDLPRCSLCMKSDDRLLKFYFDDIYEYDIFKIYEAPGKLFCNEKFREFCVENSINNILEFMKPIK